MKYGFTGMGQGDRAYFTDILTLAWVLYCRRGPLPPARRCAITCAAGGVWDGALPVVVRR